MTAAHIGRAVAADDSRSGRPSSKPTQVGADESGE